MATFADRPTVPALTMPPPTLESFTWMEFWPLDATLVKHGAPPRPMVAQPIRWMPRPSADDAGPGREHAQTAFPQSRIGGVSLMRSIATLIVGLLLLLLQSTVMEFAPVHLVTVRGLGYKFEA